MYNTYTFHEILMIYISGFPLLHTNKIHMKGVHVKYVSLTELESAFDIYVAHV
jgi:hypothetical protein